MVNVSGTRCAHNSCMKHPSFNFEGSGTPTRCKQHAEEGMTIVSSKRCSHGSCTRQPSLNVKGKKEASCNSHAEHGMVDLCSTRCSFDSWVKYPSYNAVGMKATYCRPHAEVGMVDVRNMRCSQGPCMKRPSFNAVYSKTPTYRKQHAEDGMVSVRTRCSSKDSRTAGSARCVPNDVETTPCTMLNGDTWDDSLINVRKRPRWAHGGEQPPHSLEHGPFRGDVIQTAGVSPSKGVSHTTSSHFFRRDFGDDAVGTAVQQTGQITSKVLTPLPDEHQSVEPVKTDIELVKAEIELVVLL